MRAVNEHTRLVAIASRLGALSVAIVLILLFVQAVGNMNTVAPANPYANDIAATLPVEDIDARMGKGNSDNSGSGKSESHEEEENDGDNGDESDNSEEEADQQADNQDEPSITESSPQPTPSSESEEPSTSNEPKEQEPEPKTTSPKQTEPEESAKPAEDSSQQPKQEQKNETPSTGKDAESREEGTSGNSDDAVTGDGAESGTDEGGSEGSGSGSEESDDRGGDISGDGNGATPGTGGTGGTGDQAGGANPGGTEGDASDPVVNPESPNGDGGNAGDDEAMKPGELTLVTDLSNRTVLYSEVVDDTLEYYAYLQNNKDELDLEVRWFKRGDTVGTLQAVKEDGKSFSTKLTHGTNTFLVNLRDDAGTVVKTYQFSINYAADEATADNPEVGRGISIETNLDGHSGIVENPRFTFLVRASSQGKEEGAAREELFSEQITVAFDGQVLSNPTGVGTGWYEYPVNFPPPMVGDEEEHTLTVTASDEYGNSKFVDYKVTFRNIGDGEVLGNVSISIDATAVGLGVIDSDIVEVLQGETAAETLVRFLEERAYIPVYRGDMEADNFYLQGIEGGFSGADIVYAPEGQWLLDALEQDGVSTNLGYDGWGLYERDFTNQSGWTVQINGRFPGRGLGAFNLDNGDAMTLFFTLAENKDITGTPNGKGIFRDRKSVV